jgi:hypothetical protein
LVTGTAKGSAFDQGQGNLEPSTVADVLWKLYSERTERRATV